MVACHFPDGSLRTYAMSDDLLVLRGPERDHHRPPGPPPLPIPLVEPRLPTLLIRVRRRPHTHADRLADDARRRQHRAEQHHHRPSSHEHHVMLVAPGHHPGATHTHPAAVPHTPRPHAANPSPEG